MVPCSWNTFLWKTKTCFYPVLCPKLTLIQPTWSAYPYHLVFLIWYPYSLVFLIWYPFPLFPYMVILPIVLGVVLLWAAMDSPLSQGPLLWRQADVPREDSGRGGPVVRPAAADFPRDVCLTVSRHHAVFLLYHTAHTMAVNSLRPSDAYMRR